MSDGPEPIISVGVDDDGSLQAVVDRAAGSIQELASAADNFNAKSAAMEAQMEANRAALDAERAAAAALAEEYQNVLLAAQLNILNAEEEQRQAMEAAVAAQNERTASLAIAAEAMRELAAEQRALSAASTGGSAAFSELDGALDELNARIDELLSHIAEFAINGDEAALSFAAALGGVREAAVSSVEDVAALKGQVEQLAASYLGLGQSGASVVSTSELMNELANATLKASDGFAQFALQSSQGVNRATLAVADLDKELNSAAMEALQLSESLQGPLAEVSTSFRNAAGATQAEVDSIDDLAAAFRDEQLQAEVDKMVALEEATRAETEAAATLKDQWAETLAMNDQRAAGYGVSGGLPGPAEDTGEGGSGVGSAFAIGHGLSVAGHALGAPGLREAGGFVYIEESLRRVGPLLEQMNTALLASGEVIPGLTGSLVALNIPMAGLVAAAIPLGAAVITLGIALAGLKATLDVGAEAVARALNDVDLYYKAVEKGTTDSLNQEIASLDARRAATQKHFDQINQQIASAIQQAQAAGIGEVLKLPTTTAFQEMGKSASELRDELKKLQDQIDADTKALTDEQVAANTRAEQARQNADEDVRVAAQQLADDNLSTQAINDKLVALHADKDAQDKAADAVRKANQGLVEGSTAWQENQKAIAAHEQASINDANEIDHLTNVSMGLAETREAETNAINAEDAAMQRHITYLEQATKLRETGTEQQFASARAGLEGRLSGDQVDLAYLQGKTDPTAAEKKKIEDLKADIVEVTNDLADLDKNIKPIVDVRAAIEDSAKALDDFSKKSSTLANDLAIQSATARERETNAERQYTEGSLQDTFERTKIATAESRKVLDIEQQTSDKIVDIVTKFGEKQEDLALDLRRQEEDDVTKYNDGVVKAETDAQRQAESDKVDHLERLADLERQSNIDKQQALLDRNFLELTKIDLHKADAIQKEDDSFNQREAKLQVHLKQQEEDLFRSLQQEERLQMVQEQRKVEDATRAAQREIEVANLAETRKIEAAQQSEDQQLADLTINETYKIQLLRQGLQDELTLMAEAEQAKLTLLAATRDAIIAQSIASLTQMGNPSSPGGPPQGIGPVQGPSTFDSGGSFSAGQWLTKGSLSEEFDFGGSAYNLGGAALIYPLQGGTVTPGKSGGDIHYAPTIQVSGSVDQQTLAQLQRLLQTHGDSLIQQVGEMLSP